MRGDGGEVESLKDGRENMLIITALGQVPRGPTVQAPTRSEQVSGDCHLTIDKHAHFLLVVFAMFVAQEERLILTSRDPSKHGCEKLYSSDKVVGTRSPGNEFQSIHSFVKDTRLLSGIRYST